MATHQIHRQFPHITSNVNEVAIIIGLRSAYSGRKITKNQYEALKIKNHTNLVDGLKEAGKGLEAMHVHNLQ